MIKKYNGLDVENVFPNSVNNGLDLIVDTRDMTISEILFWLNEHLNEIDIDGNCYQLEGFKRNPKGNYLLLNFAIVCEVTL